MLAGLAAAESIDWSYVHAFHMQPGASMHSKSPRFASIAEVGPTAAMWPSRTRHGRVLSRACAPLARL